MREEVLYKVFLEMRKAYVTLNHDRCMDIILGYGVGLRAERILRYYWDHLYMLAIAGLYYGTPFKVPQGVNHRDPISPTIFNMVFGAVICHWLMLVAGEEAVPDGFGWVA